MDVMFTRPLSLSTCSQMKMSFDAFIWASLIYICQPPSLHLIVFNDNTFPYLSLYQFLIFKNKWTYNWGSPSIFSLHLFTILYFCIIIIFIYSLQNKTILSSVWREKALVSCLPHSETSKPSQCAVTQCISYTPECYCWNVLWKRGKEAETYAAWGSDITR